MLFIYILQLEKGKYYVGKTTNPNFRLNNHFNNDGSEWTKKYKPIRLIELKPNCDNYDEDKITRQYMDKYGIHNVRGGSFVSLKLDNETINFLEKMSNGTNDKCFNCGKKGHFVKDCIESQCYNVDYDNDSGIEENEIEEDEIEELEELKKQFIRDCSKYNNKLISGELIIKIFKKYDINMNLHNLYGLCYTINHCDDLTPLLNYRHGINYKDFIEGFIYICINDPQICEECEQETCCCNKKCNLKGVTCFRCGRKGHYSSNCYASKHIKGYEI